MRFSSLKKLTFSTIFIFCFVTITGYKLIEHRLYAKNVQAINNVKNSYSVIVGYNDNTTAQNLAKKFHGKITKLNFTHKMFKMKLTNAKSSISDTLSIINKDKGVAFSQPVYTYKTTDASFPNDTNYSRQWGLKKVNAVQAWKLSKTNKKVIVAVIDTGITKNHPDLKGNIISGYNFVKNKIDATDDQGHGTHVAGIIAATINNKKGIAGIANNVKIMPVKVLDKSGAGDDFTIASGIFWAADHGAKVISMSLGGKVYDSVLAKAINYAHSKGAVLVAAAGNKFGLVEASPLKVYPVSLPNVIGVGAVNKNLSKAPFSYIGDYVDICAPGQDIYSTYLKDKYVYMSGTSMATPFVSGLAAMIIGKYPSLTPADVERVIEETSTDLGDPGKDENYGYGFINAEKALNGIYLNSVSAKNISSSVKISYGISNKANISIKIYDSNDKLIKTLINRKSQSKGTHTINWSKKDSKNSKVTNGNYNIKITVTNSKGLVVDTVNKSVSIDDN
ncbi:S8 family serine peptidase [Clostridium oryzae]|uniref:Thermophilic serine proteinase n=1 Tax=Clostridium oryzae TaxID=1450648 RepID=A0A1V4IGR8_9CLOT|nr:S8 family serine peptidase [Clostridium oryzae]OPJ59181.1 thermophilic serine proteinase precursor [Clostridium oryzae]